MGTQILRLDRWIHLGFPVDLPTDVDLQAGVRRVRTFHRPQKMLLNSLEKTKQIWMPPRSSAFIPSVCLLIFLICYFPLASNLYFAFDRVRWSSSSSSSSLPCGALRRRRLRYHQRTFNQTGQVCFVVKRTRCMIETKENREKKRIGALALMSSAFSDGPRNNPLTVLFFFQS